jgi:peptidoglycan/LPS O-acetylase OafA/YrhL
MTERSGAETAFHPRLEALRGLAALAVAAFHSWYAPWLDVEGRAHQFLAADPSDGPLPRLARFFGRIIANGDGAVVIFFVLSGFVLAGSLERGPAQLLPAGRRFLIARLFRIYPAIAATVIMFAVAFWLTGKQLMGADSFSPAKLLSNMLLLEVSIDPVMWSLQVEVLAIPLVFAAYFIFRRWGMPALGALSALLIGLSFSGGWQNAIPGVHQFGTVFAFMLGVMAYVLAPPLLRQWSPRTAQIALVITAVAFFATRPLVGFTSNWSVILEATFGAAIVALLAFAKSNKQNALLDSSLARFYGKISYSFYLVHPLTLLVLWSEPALLGRPIASGVPEGVVAVLLFVGSTLAVTPLAWAMQRWIERPGIAAGRSIARAGVFAPAPDRAIAK